MKKPKLYSPQRIKGNSTFKIPRLYDTPEWKEYSRRFLNNNPKCYACGERSGATDHWTAHKNDIDLFWKEDNMLPLCSKCHNIVTSNYDKFNPPKTEEKLQWINQMRVVTGTTLKVKITAINWKRKKEFVEITDLNN